MAVSATLALPLVAVLFFYYIKLWTNYRIYSNLEALIEIVSSNIRIIIKIIITNLNSLTLSAVLLLIIAWHMAL